MIINFLTEIIRIVIIYKHDKPVACINSSHLKFYFAAFLCNNFVPEGELIFISIKKGLIHDGCRRIGITFNDAIIKWKYNFPGIQAIDIILLPRL